MEDTHALLRVHHMAAKGGGRSSHYSGGQQTGAVGFRLERSDQYPALKAETVAISLAINLALSMGLPEGLATLSDSQLAIRAVDSLARNPYLRLAGSVRDKPKQLRGRHGDTCTEVALQWCP